MGSGGIPAPYGAACKNCSKAKVRCILRPGGPCERCHRLGNTCQSLAPTRKISRRPKDPVSNTQLEQKLDDLITVLRGSGRSDMATDLGVSFRDRLCKSTETQPPVLTPPVTDPPIGASAPPTIASASTWSNEPLASQTVSPAPVPVHIEELSTEEAEFLFQSFRSHKLKYFPFVHFPSHVSAADVRRELPFLWMNIRMVTQKKASQQQAIGLEIRKTVAQRLVIEHERSYDLLLGLLAYTGWCMYQQGPKPFVCLYCQMMTSLINDLGLYRRQSDWQNPMLRWKYSDAAGPGFAHTRNMLGAAQMLEHRRTILAAFLITSSIPSFMLKLEPLRWSSHLDESLHILEEARECPNDAILIALIKMELIANAASRGSWHSEEAVVSFTGSDPTSSPPSFDPPPMMLISMLRSRLDDITRLLSPEILSEPIVAGQRFVVELAIYDILVSSLGKSKSRPQAGNVPEVGRLEILYSCLQTAKGFFDHFLALPPTALTSFSFIVPTQLSHCLNILYRLTILEDPVWDRSVARSTIDVLDTLNDVAVKMARVPEEMGIISDGPEGDMFAKSARMMRSMRAYWAMDLEKGSGGDGVPAPADTGDTEPTSAPVNSGVMDFDFMGGSLDSGWLSDFLAPLEAERSVGSRADMPSLS